MKRKIRVFPLAISILTILAGAAFAELSKEQRGEADSTKIKVFIVQSYEKDHVCGTPQGRGIEASLTKEFKDRLDIIDMKIKILADFAFTAEQKPRNFVWHG